MSDQRYERETKGAWIVHHGQKISLDARAPSEFPALDEAAKAANLLARLGETDQTTLPRSVVQAVAKSAGLNPRYELEGLLRTLQKRRLIDSSDDEVVVLGVTTRSVLGHAADLFEKAQPSNAELATLDLAELVSRSPTRVNVAREHISDMFQMSSVRTREFLEQSAQIGFVDVEGHDTDKLFFNGNLFRRDNVRKVSRVLDSLDPEERNKLNDFEHKLRTKGCLPLRKANNILGKSLLKKLLAASLYDRHTVSNEDGENVFLTSPAAFHKFIDPLVDDSFDMAKAFVAALYYGMTRSTHTRGRIMMIDALLSKLIRGETVGPASAIGHDYKVLEERRVVRIIPRRSGFLMKLLKKDIGEIALQVLQSGDANLTSVTTLPSAPMSAYSGPEDSRMRIRKSQSDISKRQTHDVLMALRSGREI